MLCLRGFISKSTEIAQVFLKNGTRDFENSHPFEISACFYVTITGNFGRFRYFKQTLNKLSEKQKPFPISWSATFQLKVLRLKTQNCHTKMPFQKPMLKQIEWEVQNGPLTKNAILAVTNFFLEFGFRIRTSYKELI